MYTVDFDKPIHIHFIGIGGISMSGLAEILLKEGFLISGSDAKSSELTERLEQMGAVIHYPQSASNISGDIDVVVYTAAIHPDNPEYAAAKAHCLPLLTRAQLLGQIMRNYDMPIAVAGTHGKTTTTSLASHILMAANCDPTISVGGILPSIHGNIRVGQSETFITEACEYTNSFLSFYPKIGLILNIDADHLDFFKDIDDIRNSFHEFARLLPPDGTLVINADTPNYKEITGDLNCEVLTYALDHPADYMAKQITFDPLGHPTFVCTCHGQNIGTFSLMVPGIHNVSNALATIALARKLGFTPQIIQEGFSTFTGTDRRFQYKGRLGDITVIDDYAHHPTEITATLKAVRNLKKKTTWCVFQPHTYTRTAALLEEFAHALTLADKVVLADIYAAREVNTIGISSRDLQEQIQKLGTTCYYFSTFDEIENFLLENCDSGDLILTMGAGDVVKIGENLLGI